MLAPTNTYIPFPRSSLDGSLVNRFEQQVVLYPQHEAVCGKHSLTYAALNALSNRIAHSILARRGSDSEAVALLLAYDAPAIAALLGVLKSGKFYVALDSANPPAHLSELLADAGAELIICDVSHHGLAVALAGDKRRVFDLDTPGLDEATTNPDLAIAPDALACLIYTAGSTGRSKGVIHTHRTLLHLALTYTDSIRLSAADRHESFTPLSFANAAWALYGSLLNGACLCLKDLRADGIRDLAQWLRDRRITIFDAPASLFRFLASELRDGDEFPALRLVSIGGEPVRRSDVELFRRCFRPPCLLRNALASSETASIACFFLDHAADFPGSQMPVGYPLPDKEVLLLVESGQPVSGACEGEIAVRSRYLSPGYWQQPNLSAERFSADPADPSLRLYRTGDLGRRLSDGSLVHLGRIDFQVKIRGQRVEPAEVESALLGLAGVREAFVLAREDTPGESRLVAYVVADEAHTTSALRAALSRTLPDYAVPSAFIRLDTIPLTPSAKIDRSALPPPGRARPTLAAVYVAPTTPLEIALAAIWSDVLHIEGIGAHDPFLELGGDSLLAAKIAARVLDTVALEIPVATLLGAGTIAEMGVVVLGNWMDGERISGTKGNMARR